MQYTLLQGATVIVKGWERDAANDMSTKEPAYCGRPVNVGYPRDVLVCGQPGYDGIFQCANCKAIDAARD